MQYKRTRQISRDIKRHRSSKDTNNWGYLSEVSRPRDEPKTSGDKRRLAAEKLAQAGDGSWAGQSLSEKEPDTNQADCLTDIELPTEARGQKDFVHNGGNRNVPVH
jgi:hypothetical protein